ncbi:tetratricopeptide repeat protein [Phenylobacterium sp. LjRoot164]|uniref:tetratricopeptide repeat protein n=1 Tax=unclassified Phenylobacterium TaxID=2640670 RepID=UPI003ED0E4FE
MCRMSALAATALALTLGASPALALPFGKSADKAAPADKAPAAAAPAPRKASAQERAQIARLDPLARAAFWAHETELDPNDVDAGIKLAQALRQMGNYGDALQATERTLIVAPNNVEALLEAARSQVGRGQGFYAIEPARQAQALAPRDWRIPSLLGVAYEQASRFDEALAAHRQALALAPDNPVALGNLGMYYAARGDTAQAEATLRQAAARPDAPIAVRQNLALVVGLSGRIDEAERLARQDLPPEMVENNLAWLRSARAPAASGGAPSARSWESLRQTP